MKCKENIVNNNLLIPSLQISDLKALWIQAKYNFLAFVDARQREHVMKQFGISNERPTVEVPVKAQEKKRHSIRPIAKVSSGFASSSPSVLDKSDK